MQGAIQSPDLFYRHLSTAVIECFLEVRIRPFVGEILRRNEDAARRWNAVGRIGLLCSLFHIGKVRNLTYCGDTFFFKRNGDGRDRGRFSASVAVARDRGVAFHSNGLFEGTTSGTKTRVCTVVTGKRA